MNLKRTFSMTAMAAAGLIGVTALTGAASANAATASSAPAPTVTATQPKPAGQPAPAVQPKPVSTPKPGDAITKPVRGDRALAKVRAAVLAKYPKVTIDSIAKRGDGWVVTVTTDKGRHGTVQVDSHYTVGRLVLDRTNPHR